MRLLQGGLTQKSLTLLDPGEGWHAGSYSPATAQQSRPWPEYALEQPHAYLTQDAIVISMAAESQYRLHDARIHDTVHSPDPLTRYLRDHRSRLLWFPALRAVAILTDDLGLGHAFTEGYPPVPILPAVPSDLALLREEGSLLVGSIHKKKPIVALVDGHGRIVQILQAPTATALSTEATKAKTSQALNARQSLRATAITRALSTQPASTTPLLRTWSRGFAEPLHLAAALPEPSGCFHDQIFHRAPHWLRHAAALHAAGIDPDSPRAPVLTHRESGWMSPDEGAF